MRAMLVDDEQMPLLHLKRMLECDMDEIDVIETFTDPSIALERAKALQPDVVFLDINMPQMNGLEVGERLQALLPAAQIVFVTGYDKYAVDAFDLCALDYVMKPVQLKRLQKTIQRLKERFKGTQPKPAEIKPAELEPLLRINCFTRIELQVPGTEPQSIKWRTAKARELFAYLLHHRNRMIANDTLLELFWPDCDAAKGMTQLYTTIYLIRQTVKRCGLASFLSINRENLETGYKLTVDEARFETEEWEHSVKQAGTLRTDNRHVFEQLLERYTGDYYGDYEYIWAEHERERLRRLWLQLAQKLSRFYREHRMLQEAIRIHLRIQQFYPLDEESYTTLMKLYDATGNRAAVDEQYSLLATRWQTELDSEVNEDIKEWYAQWRLA
ncbi:UNVERIFIED_CONTAM: two-component system LytT family response regulator [Brevibacillus sp. OAP136]